MCIRDRNWTWEITNSKNWLKICRETPIMKWVEIYVGCCLVTMSVSELTIYYKYLEILQLIFYSVYTLNCPINWGSKWMFNLKCRNWWLCITGGAMLTLRVNYKWLFFTCGLVYEGWSLLLVMWRSHDWHFRCCCCGDLILSPLSLIHI